jgi:para-nitrobenzyl esterase
VVRPRVKTGNPNGEGVPEWPEFRATDQVLYIDAESRARAEELTGRYRFLDEVVTDGSAD